jgi:hypothetical protein
MLSLSCKTENRNMIISYQKIIISDYNASSNLDFDKYLSKIVADVDIITLQTENAPQIKRIKKITNFNNKIFIYQGHSSPLFVYDRNGNYIQSIAVFGKGPQEVNELKDYDILSDGSVVILDYQIIHHYDKNYEYNHEVLLSKLPGTKTSFAPMNVKYQNENILLWDGSGVSSASALLAINPKEKSANKYIKIINSSSPGTPLRISSFDDTLLIIPPFLNDTIYQFFDGKCIPRYFVNFPSARSNADSKHSSADARNFQELYQYIFDHQIAAILDGFETTHFFAFNYMYNTKMYRGVFNKSERSVITSIDYGFENLFNFPVSSVKYADKTHLVSVLEPYILTKLISEGKTACTFIPETRRLQLLEKLKDVKETDNPVLMLVTFKD